MYRSNPHYIFRQGIRIALLMAGLLASLAVSAADMTGSWDTTALTRISVKQLGYSTPPSNSADIADGTYIFKTGNVFSARNIPGTWTQTGARYTVWPDRPSLEDSYRTALETSGGPDDPPVIVNGLRLQSTKFGGQQLATSTDPQNASYSLWGNESYVYWLDIGEGSTRQQLRVTMTVRVAGVPTPSLAGLTARPLSERAINPAKLAAAAVKRYLASSNGANP